MQRLPLDGVRVIEFSQMVMGPSCGMILADLGADVIKVEPLKGDRTRFFKSVASGFFFTYNRNKRSLAVDMASTDGRDILRRLVSTSDALIENFRPGMLGKFGLDYESCKSFAPRLIYCSLKGYLPGPYEHRLALDEVVQMMGGLAYMTGPPGQPMRAGASVNDLMGGMFGVIAIQAALAERQRTNKGSYIQSALFENNVFLMAQSMMFETVTGQKALPLPVKSSPWPVYDLFDTQDDKKLFVTIVGEEHWQAFCNNFDRKAWLKDPRLSTNQGRVDARDWLIPEIAAIVRQWPLDALAKKLEALNLPYAPVNTPSELFTDPHLNASGGLLDIVLPDGRRAPTPALPLSVDGQRLGKRMDPPTLGQHTDAVLGELGYSAADIKGLVDRGIVGLQVT
jgi:crotonobetainyl-CoA:carnitine CoA-transferase CaiB-like acyl-CoA transferase